MSDEAMGPREVAAEHGMSTSPTFRYTLVVEVDTLKRADLAEVEREVGALVDRAATALIVRPRYEPDSPWRVVEVKITAHG